MGVAITSQALPLIVPVALALCGERLVFCAAPGSALDLGTRGDVVCVEVDDLDAHLAGGWAVAVVGIAVPVSDPREARQVLAVPHLRSRGPDSRVVAVSTELVSGWRTAGEATRGVAAARCRRAPSP